MNLLMTAILSGFGFVGELLAIDEDVLAALASSS